MKKNNRPEKLCHCVECGAPVPAERTTRDRIIELFTTLAVAGVLWAAFTGVLAPSAEECRARAEVDLGAVDTYHRYAEFLTVPAAVRGAPPARARTKRAELLDPFAQGPDAGRAELVDPFSGGVR